MNSPFFITYSFKNILKSNFHKMNEEIMYRYLVAIRFLQQPPNFICRHFLLTFGLERSRPSLTPHHASHKRQPLVSPPILFSALVLCKVSVRSCSLSVSFLLNYPAFANSFIHYTKFIQVHKSMKHHRRNHFLVSKRKNVLTKNRYFCQCSVASY